jgi:hypothetical protein
VNTSSCKKREEFFIRIMTVEAYLTYDSIGKQEGRIRDLINEPRTQYPLIKKKGLWQQLCSSLDVIGDTELAIAAYTSQKMGSDKGSVYLAVYGLLQSLVLQQDAVFHLCESLDIKGIRGKHPRLEEIREIRNDSIGHPTKRDRTRKGKNASNSYHGISRISLSYEGFQLFTSDETGDFKFNRISIPDLLAAQNRDISLILTSIIEMLEQAVITHKDQFKEEKLVDIFSPSLGYHMQKVFLHIPNRENAQFAAVNLNVIKKALEDFQTALEKRGSELGTYDIIEDLYNLLAYPMAELEAYFQHIEKGETPNINEKTAHIFAFFISKKLDELIAVAAEIDDDYAE